MNEYENFVIKNKGPFTQSEKWANIKKGWINEQISVCDKSGNITASMQILIKTIPFLGVSFMYSPRGPVCDYKNIKAIEQLMCEADKIQRKYNGFMLKIDPMILSDDKAAIDNLKQSGFIYRDKSDDTSVQCRSNYILRINNRSEEEVFDSFHKKWRYNIRLAERKGVTCDFYGEDKLDDFYGLLKETAKRDGFNIRSQEYFQRIMKEFGEKCRLYICYYDGKPLSGAIAINYAGRVSYLYGASTQNMRNVMPCYLMQWTMIKWAIETNCLIYDFMGIPHYDEEEHPNYGVYRFKKGFNGEVVRYAGEFDYIYYPFRGAFISKALKVTGKAFL